MPVHGVGAAAAHRPQFVQSMSRGNRPQAPQPSNEGGTSVAPTSGHHPPAHGVRRLLEAGHFDGKNSYGPLTAKFGAPAGVLEENALEVEGVEEAPVEEAPLDEPIEQTEEVQTGLVIDASGTALDGQAPVVEPIEGETGLEQLLPTETEDPLDAPIEGPVTEPGLLDMDTLLMEELINETTVLEEIVEQVVESTDGTIEEAAA